MPFDLREQQRIRRDEIERAYTREQYAVFRDAQRQEEVEGDRHRQRYVLYNGRDGVLRITIVKWTLAAGFVAIFAFIGSLKDDGFFPALGQSILGFGIVSAIGVVRAYHLANSIR